MEFNIDKVAFKIFGISVMWYGIIIGIGIFSGIYFALKLAKKKNITEDSIMEMLIYAIPISLIGARLYYVIFEWRYYVANPSKILAFREGGMAIHGGIIFASITAYIYCKKNNIKFSDMADISAPGLALGQAIGRWGNFINQEAYGRETTLPWALLIDGKLVHPTFLYESLGDFIIFLLLYFYFSKKKYYDKKLFPIYMILYGVLRFFVESLRTDSLMFFGLRIAQIVSVIMIIIGFISIYIINKRNKIKEIK